MIDAVELESIRREIRSVPGGVSDGPVDLVRYAAARVRIVWLLREVHDDSGQGGWDLSAFLRDHLFDYPRWHATYGLVAKVSRALLQRPVPNALPQTGARAAADSIRDVAVVNVKKIGGSRRVDWPKLVLAASELRTLLRRQIAALTPDIVIAAGTSSLIPTFDGEKADALVAGPFGATKMSGVWMVKTYHPAQTRLTHSTIYSKLHQGLIMAGYPASHE